MLAMHTSMRVAALQTASHAHQRLEKRGNRWASATLLTCKTRPAALQNGAAWTSAARGQPYHRRSWACENHQPNHEYDSPPLLLPGSKPKPRGSLQR